MWFLLILLLAVNACAAPQWFTTGKHNRYNTEFYFVGVGSGKTNTEAQDEALANIARQIEVLVESEITTIVQAREVNDRENIESDYRSATRTISNAQLQGVRPVESTVENGIHYVICVLDKEKYAETITQDLERRAEAMRILLSNSRGLIADGKVFEGLEILTSAVEEAAELHAKSILFTSVTGRKYQLNDIIPGASIYSEVRRLLGKIRMEKISGDNQVGTVGLALPEPLMIKVSYLNDDGQIIPMPNVRLIARLDGDPNPLKSQTEGNGIAQFSVFGAGSGVNTITITLDMSRIPRAFVKDLTQHQVNFNYTMSGQSEHSLQVAVEVRDANGNRSADAENIVKKAVQYAGGTINDDAPFVLYGQIGSPDFSKINGLAGEQVIAKVELTILIKDRLNGNSLGQISVIATGMDSKSEMKASEVAINRLMINRSDMAKLLAKAR